MSRPLLIIVLVAALMASGVASASESDEVRLPMNTGSEQTLMPDSVVVEKGDHLWKISRRRLDESGVDQPVAPYWRQVIQVNLSSLRSGDPDLIYPGEVIDLPVVSERP